MIENGSIDIVVNGIANVFYSKWKADTKQSVYVFAPLSITICVVCFTMILGVSFKLLLILLLPITVIIAAFIYVPLFARRQYINGIINKVTLNHHIIEIQTFGWFKYKPTQVSLDLRLVSLTRMNEDTFFKGKNVWILRTKNFEEKDFYIIEEFFENPTILLSLICKSCALGCGLADL